MPDPTKHKHVSINTASPKLSNFLAAQERVAELESRLSQAELRSRQLRMELSVARGELATTQRAIEALDRRNPSIDNLSEGAKSTPSARRTRTQTTNELLVEIGDEVRSLQELEQALPHVDPDDLRARIVRARSSGYIVAGGGRGKYRLSELGKAALRD